MDFKEFSVVVLLITSYTFSFSYIGDLLLDPFIWVLQSPHKEFVLCFSCKILVYVFPRSLFIDI